MKNLSSKAFDAVTQLFHSVSGIRLDESKQALVNGRLQRLATEAGEPNLEHYVDKLLRGGAPAQEMTRLVDRLTTNDLEAALLETARGKSTLAEVRGADLPAALVQRLGPDAAGRLLRLAPEHVQLASGRRLRVEYVPGQPPSVRSRLQDFFGSARGPTICAGRVPLVLHLLAPNGRAQQVTTDLEGFWTRHYPAVRKELMRKYPRHPWPEDGRAAAPPAPKR